MAATVRSLPALSSDIRNRIASFETMMQVPDLAKLLAIPKPTIYQMCREDKIPHKRIGTLIRLEPSRILEWYDNQ